MTKLTLILGGQKAGKSSAAVQLAAATGDTISVIAPARAQDPELRERIVRHKMDRPRDIAVHETFDITRVLMSHPTEAMVIDALDTWLLDLMAAEGLLDVGSEPTPLGEDGQAAQERVLHRVRGMAEAARSREGQTYVVAGLVGMGMHGQTPVARRYEDLHGLATQVLGAAADRTLLVIAGKAIDIGALDVLRGDAS